MVGRPTKLTPKTKAKLEYAFGIGCTNTEACIYADIAESTFYSWIEKDEQLMERFKVLKSTPVLKAKEAIFSALSKGDVQTSKWFLERRSDDFKPKMQSDVNTNTRAQLTLSDFYKDLEEQ